MLFAVTFLFWFAQYCYSAYINPELERMGATATFMGLVGGVYGFTQLALRIPLGIAADRLNRQKLFILLGCLMALLSALGMYLCYTPVGFLVFRALSGVSSASWVCFTVLYSRYFPPKETSGRIAQLNMANQSGRLLCFVLVGLAVSLWDVRVSFVISAVGALVAFLLSFRVEDRPTERKAASLRDFLAVMRERNLCVCSLLGALGQMVAFSTVFTFASNVQKSLGATNGMLSYLNVALLVANVSANLVLGRMLLKNRDPRRMLCVGFALLAVYCLLLPAATAVWQFFPIQMLAGVGNSCTMSVLLGVCVRGVAPDRRSTAMGFFQAIYSVGMTLGPVVMGVLVDAAGVKISFALMALLSVASIPLTLVLMKREA